ncbi:hypothetical protein [Rhodoferax sp.]|uniref:hypothetical protein n=1 Tax=Rhodoferax sp. TaxID=50421 RepID=UPI002ACDD563|nr:hypothetical protein [Rhodoferax sp.]MDZ7920213.1 hypothetical protein [Rhodoferax sp.]
MDLELWSAPLDAQVPFDGKLVAEECRALTGLPGDVVLGLNFIPDITDLANLEISVASGEVTTQAFQEFCAKHNLTINRSDPFSAARFIAYAFGQPLAWLHFPAGAEGLEMARQVFAWASSRGFIVIALQGDKPLSMDQLEQYWKP